MDELYKFDNNKINISWKIKYDLTKTNKFFLAFNRNEDIKIYFMLEGFDLIRNESLYSVIDEKFTKECYLCSGLASYIIKLSSFKIFFLCGKCFYTNTPSKDKYCVDIINNGSVDNIIYTTKIEKTSHNFIYYYSISHNPEYFYFPKLINTPWYMLRESNQCKWCHKYNIFYKTACYKCWNFSKEHYCQNILLKCKYIQNAKIFENIFPEDINIVIINIINKLYKNEFGSLNLHLPEPEPKSLNIKKIENININKNHINKYNDEEMSIYLHDFYDRLIGDDINDCDDSSELINYQEFSDYSDDSIELINDNLKAITY